MNYKKVLVAVDLNDPKAKLEENVKSFHERGAEVHICTVILPLELMYSFVPIGGYSVAVGGVQEELMETAQKGLSELAERLGIPEKNAHLLVGKSSTEIKYFAEENSIDLIVLGTHGKGAIRAALGSTSNGVLHGAPCDVLAINLGE